MLLTAQVRSVATSDSDISSVGTEHIALSTYYKYSSIRLKGLSRRKER